MFSIFLVAVSYLIGSVPVGVLVGRLFGFDPRAVGSGNIGMTNVARVAGRGAATITFAGDLLKGAIPALAARAIAPGADTIVLVALAAFTGSIFSLFLRLKGGRGVATSLGIWLALAPIATLIALAVFLIVLAITRIVSLGSICAAIAMPILILAMDFPRSYVALVIVMAALIVLRHRDNISRLAGGVEPKLGNDPA
ncbi:MAG TPA: glycerol-3-phosphate 1-O-acyltransferase PlsY [Candidatus Binataceae bacterium]|nr:glycerol-3-phosphate 1-O-acyltransferase PlsY [Candidatus Binataceae bacterium]